MASTSTTAIAATMNDKFSIKSFGTHFVPKDPRAMSYGKETLMIYPKITADMPLSEKAHAFNVNRAAIEASSLNPSARLQLMGSLHNADTIVNILRSEWESTAFEACMDRSKMTLESYNDPTGSTINNWKDTATGHLLIAKDGPVAECRPDLITHMKVQVCVDFSTIDAKHGKKIKFTTFLNLQLKSQIVKNSGGTERTLNTYLGNPDPLGLPHDDFIKEIFEHSESISDPYELDQATFTSTSATVNIDKKKKEILTKVHKAAYEAILLQIFESICPNFLDDPERSFNQIKQTDMDSNMSLTVTQYYSVAMALLNNFKRGRDVT